MSSRLSARDTLVVAESLRKILGSSTCCGRSLLHVLCYIDWCLHADNVCTPNAVREHPDKERFRSLNLESKAFHSRVGRYVALPSTRQLSFLKLPRCTLPFP